MEFAATLDARSETPIRLCLLQVREMAVSGAAVEVSATLAGQRAPRPLGTRSSGTGVEESVADVVYVRPGVFEQRHAPRAAEEVAALCRPLREAAEAPSSWSATGGGAPPTRGSASRSGGATSPGRGPSWRRPSPAAPWR